MSETPETLKRRTSTEPPGDTRTRTASTAAITTTVEDRIPQHPYMATNGRSNVHCDAFMSDTYEVAGPVNSNLYLKRGVMGGICVSITFNKSGQVLTLAVTPADNATNKAGDRTLVLADPISLEKLATYSLPHGDPKDWGGAAYFYLNDKDQPVVSTTDLRVIFFAVKETPGTWPDGTPKTVYSFDPVKQYHLAATLQKAHGTNAPTDPSTPIDSILSVVPDWLNRLWFVTTKGIVGYISPDAPIDDESTIHLTYRLPGEQIYNSVATDFDGGVYVVSDTALYRFDAVGNGAPTLTWREEYENTHVKKPGQKAASSGTTPTLQNYKGRRYVSIADNANPMKVVVYRREARYPNPRKRFEFAPFPVDAGCTENSLIGINNSIVVENNYGYANPASIQGAGITEPGLLRINFNEDGTGGAGWKEINPARAPSVVPKLSLQTGLVYTYQKKEDGWYFTAINFSDGQTAFEKYVGEGQALNSHYAGLHLSPEGRVYIGTFEGIVSLTQL
ncbi:MAG TPA: hypothetical protein VGV59_09055 [Pyrinomonadaceae bacterium]|nr:hypothetical protein [Pyrinomonadaceae bacterium]